MRMMHKTAAGLALAAAVCAGTSVTATAAPMDSGYAICDGNTSCSTGVLSIGAGTVYADFDLGGLGSTTVTITVTRNGKQIKDCSWSVLLPRTGTISGTRACDFFDSGDVQVNAYAQVTATTFRIGWHQ